MSDKVNQTRTIALVGHGGAGKTSLAEAMLFNAKAVDRLGKVDEGNTVLDFEPEEIKRGGSVSASFGHYSHKKHDVHLVDCPGDDNFLFDAASALRAVDGAIMVIDAIDGIKVQGEKVWQFVQAAQTPALVVVNKMDRERANFDAAVNMIPDMLGVKGVRLQLPIGAADGFGGVVDLLSNKAYTFAKDGSGKMEIGEIPADMADEVEALRESLIEDIAEADDSLMERYLEGESVSDDELAAALKKGVIERLFVPVTACAALRNIGVQSVMDLVNRLLPSPVEAGAVSGVDVKTGEEIQRQPSADEPFCGLVFKTVADPFAGRLSMVRVFSGKLTSELPLLNPNKDAKERFGQLYLQTGKTQKAIAEALPGDIVAIPKLKETATGDTLCEDKSPIKLQPVPPMPAVISYAIEAKEKGDEEKLFAGINKLLEEDPTLRLDRDPATGEALLGGMGSVHIETTLERLRRKFNVEVNLKTPKVPYRETIKGKTKVQGRYKKQTGGRGQFGDTWIEIEPAGEGEGYVFVDAIVGGSIPPAIYPRRGKRHRRGPVAGRLGRLSHGRRQSHALRRLVPPGGQLGNGLQGGRLHGLQKRRAPVQAHHARADHEVDRHRARRRHGRRHGRHQLAARPSAGHGVQGLVADHQRPGAHGRGARLPARTDFADRRSRGLLHGDGPLRGSAWRRPEKDHRGLSGHQEGGRKLITRPRF